MCVPLYDGGNKAALHGVELGALHKALSAECAKSNGGAVGLQQFIAVVQSLSPRGSSEAPQSTIEALFKAMDTDGSGAVDQAEVVAGCQILCGGDRTAKLRLAFQCYDTDGDGHLSKDEVGMLLKGAVTKAVKVLHSSIDFAVEEAAAFGEEVTPEELENQGVEIDEDPEGKVTVTLQTDAGEVSMRRGP